MRRDCLWMSRASRCAVAVSALLWASASLADSGPYPVPATGRLEVAFAPNQSAEILAIRVIDSANGELHVMAYGFTNKNVVKAIIRARGRGVSVFVLADYHENIQDDRYGHARAALSALASAGCAVRTVSAFRIFHEKVLIAGRNTVATGSFNWTSAARSNSENILVNWENPTLASVYLTHFDDRWQVGVPYQTTPNNATTRAGSWEK